MRRSFAAPRWFRMLMGLLSTLAVMAVITGNDLWLWFMLFGLVPVTLSIDTDERFFANLSRAGLLCFLVAMLGLAGILVYHVLRPSVATILPALGGLWVFLSLLFPGALIYYEKRGV